MIQRIDVSFKSRESLKLTKAIKVFFIVDSDFVSFTHIEDRFHQ